MRRPAEKPERPVMPEFTYRPLIPYAGMERPALPGEPCRSPLLYERAAHAARTAKLVAKRAKLEAEARAASLIERVDVLLAEVPPRRGRIVLKLLDERLCKRAQAAPLRQEPEKESTDETD